MSILSDWTETQINAFQKEKLVARHTLDKMDMFSDDALAELLDRHPTEKLDVCMMPGKGEICFRTGDFRRADGKTLIELVKQGDIWINMREALNSHSDYKVIMDQLYGELTAATKAKFINPRGGILISSPAAKVPYHCDATETMLWHIRGEKDVYVYPNNQDYLRDEEYEDQITNHVNDYLTYTPEMGAAARVHSLLPGEVICWPFNTPHKVVNKSYCVSVTTEYTNLKSVFKNSVIYTNAFLRQKMGRNPSWYNAGLTERVIKAGAGQVLRRMKALKAPENADMVSFRVDKNVPGYIEFTQPFVRNF